MDDRNINDASLWQCRFSVLPERIRVSQTRRRETNCKARSKRCWTLWKTGRFGSFLSSMACWNKQHAAVRVRENANRPLSVVGAKDCIKVAGRGWKAMPPALPRSLKDQVGL